MIYLYHTFDTWKHWYHTSIANQGVRSRVRAMTRNAIKGSFPIPYLQLLALGTGLVLSACAASPSPISDLGPEKQARLQHICADTMQLDPGNAHFVDCMAVLGDVARKIDQAKAQP